MSKIIKVKNNETGTIHDALLDLEDEVTLRLKLYKSWQSIYIYFSKSGEFLKATNYWEYRDVLADWELVL